MCLWAVVCLGEGCGSVCGASAGVPEQPWECGTAFPGRLSCSQAKTWALSSIVSQLSQTCTHTASRRNPEIAYHFRSRSHSGDSRGSFSYVVWHSSWLTKGLSAEATHSWSPAGSFPGLNFKFHLLGLAGQHSKLRVGAGHRVAGVLRVGHSAAEESRWI